MTPAEEQQPTEAAPTATQSPAPLDVALKGLRDEAAKAAPLTAQLPHKYSAVTLAGGGRYLAFLVPEQEEVLLFDVLARKIVTELPGAKAGDLIVGSRQKLLVISPDSMMIASWDLATRKRQRIVAIGGGDTPRRAALGCGGDGPLLLAGEKAQLIDVESLKMLPMETPVFGGAGREGFFVQAAYGGGAFAGIAGSGQGSPYRVMTLDGTRATIAERGNMDGIPRWVSLTADGSLVLANAQVFRAGGRPVVVKAFDAAGIPTVDPRYFLALSMTHKAGKSRLSFYTVADCELVLEEEGFEELVPKEINSWHDIVPAMLAQHAWRIQYLPWANMIVTLPQENNRVVLRPFNLEQRLKAAGKEYLYADSIPPQVAYVGEQFSYQVHAVSPRAKVTFSKEDGPAEMKVTPAGKVIWKVPDTFAEPFVRIIVRMRDGKREAFHSFEVVVRRRAIIGNAQVVPSRQSAETSQINK